MAESRQQGSQHHDCSKDEHIRPAGMAESVRGQVLAEVARSAGCFLECCNASHSDGSISGINKEQRADLLSGPLCSWI